MRKKIKVSDLCIGMYVDKLDGNWLQHPFWKSAFNLIEVKDLKAIQECGIKFLWIDTDKGEDIKEKSKVEKPVVDTVKPEKVAAKSVSLEQEMEHARATLAKSKAATISMFKEARMGNSIKIDEAAPLVDEICQSVARNPGAMLSLTRIKNKDDYTYLHSVAVCALMIALGKQLNYKGDIQALGMAGLLHDVGKAAIPDEILNKPGKLTDEEFNCVMEHPKKGWGILKKSYGVDKVSLDVCLHHHEKINGKGYPEKLSGKDISLEAKMGAVCDVYDAITSNRSYKKGWEPADSLKKMAEWKDGHFDDDVFNAFVKSIGIYPVGTLIKLKSGRLAVVVEQSEKSLLQPKLKVFFSCSSNSPLLAKIIDLARSQENIDSIEEPETWGFDRQKIMDIMG
jgi:putative nucleotidyltransferase with HDIG domain